MEAIHMKQFPAKYKLIREKILHNENGAKLLINTNFLFVYFPKWMQLPQSIHPNLNFRNFEMLISKSDGNLQNNFKYLIDGSVKISFGKLNNLTYITMNKCYLNALSYEKRRFLF